jgi:hypothetical protein
VKRPHTASLPTTLDWSSLPIDLPQAPRIYRSGQGTESRIASNSYERFSIALVFEKAGSIVVEVMAEEAETEPKRH